VLFLPKGKRTENVLQTTANMLKEKVADKQYVDVGENVERHVGVTRTQLDTSIRILREEGYEVHGQDPAAGHGEGHRAQGLGQAWYHTEASLGEPVQRPAGHRRSKDGGRTYVDVQPPSASRPSESTSTTTKMVAVRQTV
jgi:biotin operon repressor